MAIYRSKYKAKKVTVGDQKFDSKKEYQRWKELSLLERAGKISDLRRQVKYVLIPAQYKPDTIGPRGGVRKGALLEREVSYIADFVYIQDGKQIVEDVKGVRTDTYILKRKLMLWLHNIRIREV